MKALSVRQPWAWLICHGHKDIENRTWATPFRGKFLVHAGKTFDSEGYEWVRTHFPDIPMPLPSEFEIGGMVGTAEVVECIAPGAWPFDKPVSLWYQGQYGFLLANAAPMAFMPAKGQLNFFHGPKLAQELGHAPEVKSAATHAIEIVRLLRRCRLRLSSEKHLQEDIAFALEQAAVRFSREKRLSPQDIPDFLTAHGVVIECKVHGKSPKMSIYDQLVRYASYHEVHAIVLAGNIAMGLPPQINNKPAYFASLSHGWM